MTQAAMRGNQFWRRRKTHGRPALFETPEQLWASACDYFQWAENNPLYRTEYFTYRGELIPAQVKKYRPFTLGGLLLFIGLSYSGWLFYCRKNDFVLVSEHIKSVIYDQQFALACAGLLNPCFIARHLGMRDGQQSKRR